MRGSEVANFRHKDVSFGQDQHGSYVTVFIVSSKTDQSELGVSRSLYASGSLLCPVKNLKKWTQCINSDPESTLPLFGPATLEKLRGILKWAAHANHLPVGRFSLHSMRVGGATCLFLQGISLDDIRKYGRWKTTSANIYLYFDDVVFRPLGKRFVPGQGVLNQLQMLEEKGVVARTSSKYVNLQKQLTVQTEACLWSLRTCVEDKRGITSESSMATPEYTAAQAEAADLAAESSKRENRKNGGKEESKMEKVEARSPKRGPSPKREKVEEVKTESPLSGAGTAGKEEIV